MLTREDLIDGLSDRPIKEKRLVVGIDWFGGEIRYETSSTRKGFFDEGIDKFMRLVDLRVIGGS